MLNNINDPTEHLKKSLNNKNNYLLKFDDTGVKIGSGRGFLYIISFVVSIIIILASIFWGLFASLRIYNVWSQAKEGEAELAKANWNKQIIVQEAKAKEESASLLAQAEIKRAEGVATANKIIGDSLRQNEAYLRYLWITDVAAADQKGKTVVYVPTETNMPILEANRLKKN